MSLGSAHTIVTEFFVEERRRGLGNPVGGTQTTVSSSWLGRLTPFAFTDTTENEYL